MEAALDRGIGRGLGFTRVNVSGFRAGVLTDYFLHPVDNAPLRKGANPILWDLVAFLRDDLGMRVQVHQISPIPRREFRGLTILGHDADRDELGMFPRLNLGFYRSAAECDLRIYFRWHLGFPRLLPGSVVVATTIGPPHPATVNAACRETGRWEWEGRLREVLASAQSLVAQDRSAINALKAIVPGYEHRQAYLPPGVDLALFKPAESCPRRSGLRVFCPGELRLALDCAATNIRLYERPPDLSTAGRLRSRSVPGERRHYWSPLAPLHNLLHNFDLCLIPGGQAEDAAYYALPALASGLPVVTAMGGSSSELVVDGWNGLLVQPGSGENLSSALGKLARDGERLRFMGDNARRLAEGYPIGRWKERWRTLIEETLDGGRR